MKNVLAVVLQLILAVSVNAQHVLDVTFYGAKGDGLTDDALSLIHI